MPFVDTNLAVALPTPHAFYLIGLIPVPWRLEAVSTASVGCAPKDQCQNQRNQTNSLHQKRKKIGLAGSDYVQVAIMWIT